MGAICLIDTSIFLEILNVPHKASQSELIFQELKEKIEAGESLFLPMATILETGNHIAKAKMEMAISDVFVQKNLSIG